MIDIKPLIVKTMRKWRGFRQGLPVGNFEAEAPQREAVVREFAVVAVGVFESV